MKTYELTYIISPETTLEAAEQISKEIESAVQSREGTILRQINPTAKTLAYPVAKRASGFLGILDFQLEPEKLVEVQEIVKKDGKIVRHMVIIKETQRIRKERRGQRVPQAKVPPVFEIERKTEVEPFVKDEKPASVKTMADKEKVELKDIDEQLEELLG